MGGVGQMLSGRIEFTLRLNSGIHLFDVCRCAVKKIRRPIKKFSSRDARVA